MLYSCVLWCLPAFFAYLVLLIFMGMILPARLKHWWQYILLAFGICLFNAPKVIWGAYSVQADIFRLLAIPVTLVAIPLLCFEGPTWKRLLLNLLLTAGQCVGDMLALSTLLDLKVIRNPAVFYQTLTDSIAYAVIGTAVSALVDSGVTIFARSLKAKRFSGIYLPVVLIVFSLGMSYYAYVSASGVLFWLICIAMGGISIVFLLYYVIALEKKTALEQELQSIHYRLELEQAHYSAVEARREELAKIRHDFNNQLTAIGLMMQSGEKKDAQTMIAQLSADIAATRENAYCAIPVVNAVLTEKEVLCRRMGIALRTELVLPETLNIEPLHLCSILSNLLDNAIHSCTGMEEPVITLSSAMAGDYLFIKVVDPSAPPKVPEKGHGYGTKILRELAAKYHGSYETSYEDGFFTAVISLIPREENS